MTRDFQIFAKPGSYRCNLGCDYCYYLEKADLFSGDTALRMPPDLLSVYILQHIQAHPGKVIDFSWHGGEPTLLGLDFFEQVVALQQQHCPAHRQVHNGLQTNGTRIDAEWAKFLVRNHFSVGLSLDGPAELHDRYRRDKREHGSHAKALRGYRMLQRQGLTCELLCVVNDENVLYPLQVYRFFKSLGARYITFLPLVVPSATKPAGTNGEVCAPSVPAEAFGAFLCTIFDEWQRKDIGRIKVQIFEETARVAFDQPHSVCLFRETCGDIPVVEHNGDVYACDHFVDPAHRLGNIQSQPLTTILDSHPLRAFGRAKQDALPGYCRQCDVLDMCHGECPKNRICRTPDGETGLNYLCAGYGLFFRHVRPFVTEIARQWRRPEPR